MRASTLYLVIIMGIADLGNSQPPPVPTLSEASLRKHVTCLGSKYALNLPLLPDHIMRSNTNPNTLTMQELCVKQYYGGGSRIGGHFVVNVGGYCQVRPGDAANTGRIAFDNAPHGWANRDLAMPRVLLGCLYRCFCDYGVNDRTVQPKLSDQAQFNRFGSSTPVTEFQIDVLEYTPGSARGAGVQFSDPSVLPVSRRGEYRPLLENGYDGFLNWIKLDPENHITCTGTVPNYRFPGPFQRNDFESLQEFCAVQLSGGKL